MGLSPRHAISFLILGYFLNLSIHAAVERTNNKKLVFVPCGNKIKGCFGGVCVKLDEGPRCRCRPDYTGERCETPIISPEAGSKQTTKAGKVSMTTSDPKKASCAKGEAGTSTCMFGNCDSEGYCQCSSLATGIHCETRLVFCSSAKIFEDFTCKNGGTCHNVEKCKCVEGTGGEYCENTVNCKVLKDKNFCGKNGKCKSVRLTTNEQKTLGVTTKSTYRCVCSGNYGGERCDQFADCSLQSYEKGNKLIGKCENGGECTKKIRIQGDFIKRCKCPAEYTGTYCERDYKEIVTDLLKEGCKSGKGFCEHGKCKKEKGNVTCVCKDGWLTSPLGVCEKCKEGFYGKKCSKPCSVHCIWGPICHHETGYCDATELYADGQEAFGEHCRPGYKGKKCNTEDKAVVKTIFALLGTFKNVLKDELSRAYKDHIADIRKFLNNSERIKKFPFNLANTKVSEGSVVTEFDVDFSSEVSQELDIQDAVTSRLRDDADQFSSSLGPEYKIDKSSVQVSQVVVQVDGDEEPSQRSSFFLVIAAAVGLGLLVTFGCASVIFVKYSLQKKEPAKLTSYGKRKKRQDGSSITSASTGGRSRTSSNASKKTASKKSVSKSVNRTRSTKQTSRA